MAKINTNTVSMDNETHQMYIDNMDAIVKADKEWIYNIIDKISEQESIIYENDDIIIMPNLSWKNNNAKDLYLLVIFKDKNLYSIRTLNDTHINMLEQARETINEFVEAKFGLTKQNVMMYFHYKPSVWQLHLHVVNIGSQQIHSNKLPRSHLLNTVINNIKLKADYYQTTDLEYLKFNKLN
jgi:hypothetical protein